MNTSVLSAVFKRNLVSYFSSPLGYLFIGLFVWLTAAAAFFPDAFFNDNLANLDQLNKHFAFIMLLFIPAITMSIWADEVRQGTDELLLTMPATDFDIVIGKYLAAVSIYSVALLLAGTCNLIVLSLLGKPDVGLYVCTHFGYWLMGLAMLAVGMVASFLTRNLTVAYILGFLFNLPLVVMSQVDVAPGVSHRVAGAIRQWSLGGQCEEFGRGVLSLSGCMYFALIAGIMLYLCVILLGRRHWARGDDAGQQGLHFAARCISLVVMAAAVVFILQNHDLRKDATSEQLSALSPDTIKLVGDLKVDFDKARELQREIAPLEAAEKKALDAEKKTADEKKALDEKQAKEKAAAAKSSASKPIASPGDPKTSAEVAKPLEKKPDENKSDEKKADEKKPDSKPVATFADSAKLEKLRAALAALKIQGPVRIDAYISPEVPESYLQAKINLLNVLDEFKRLGKENGTIEVNVNEIDRFDKMADIAKTRYGIVPHDVFETRNGAFHHEKIFLGVAFTSGLDKVVVPFIDRGLSPEYELVRSLCTVTKQKRKRIGVLETDAHVTGSFSMSGPTAEWLLVQELRKQYEVVPVSPADLMAPPKPGEPEKRWDVLLAVQPSAMGVQEMNGFVAAIRAGQPAVIFEDPFLFTMGGVPGTYQPRRPQNQMMMQMGQENQEKGDIRALWRLLGIDFSDGGDGDEFNPSGIRPPSSGNERIVWQRYNPYPKFGNTINPEFIFIDKSCGAETPFNQKDQISSGLQHLLFFGPGFIEDTPEAVKRLVAKWYNKQYTRQLNKELDDLSTQLDKAQKDSDEDKINDLIEKGSDVQEEYNDVSGGNEGKNKKTIQPAALHDDTNLEELIAKLGKGHSRAIGDLVTDLQNRFPLPAADENADDSGTVLLTKEAADKLAADAKHLESDADGLRRRAADNPRLKRAAELKAEAAKLNQAAARMTTEGMAMIEKSSSDDALLKLRVKWLQSAAHLKDQAAELLSKTTQRSESTVLFDEETAEQKVLAARFKEMLANMKTVGDVIKYAQEAVALQTKDRQFTPLVETGPDGGTVPVGKMIAAPDMFNPRSRLSEYRSLYYQPSKGQPYVLAAHITGKPRDRVGGSPINVVLVADVDAVNDELFEMREKGKFPGQDIEYDFDNVTFVLNALDTLAGDDRFLEIRKRRPEHRTLARFEEHARDARIESIQASEKQREEHDDVIREATKEVEKAKKWVANYVRVHHLDENAAAQLLAQKLNNLMRKLEETRAESDQKYDRTLEQINNNLDARILSMQANYKRWAVLVPPIPLLLVALGVFVYRRSKEREGVSSQRLR
jgi:hypothetical protein